MLSLNAAVFALSSVAIDSQFGIWILLLLSIHLSFLVESGLSFSSFFEGAGGLCVTVSCCPVLSVGCHKTGIVN